MSDLGPGPNRFAPAKNERTIEQQYETLNEKERKCIDRLKSKWRSDFPEKADLYDDAMYLRFARCSPGVLKFNEKTAWKVMKKFDERYLTLTAEKLQDQLLTKTLFPVPGLKTKDGNHDVFYMRPARYFPSKTSTKEIIDNLAYCMTTMVETSEKACAEGIGFYANMDDWKMSNFSVDYCFQFMMMLQGRVPVRVRLFLIVNPPKWFDSIWKIMKPMLSSDFRQKVHVIPDTLIGTYLADGFEQYLCDDVAKYGTVDTDQLVKDYVTYRKHVESSSEKN